MQSDIQNGCVRLTVELPVDYVYRPGDPDGVLVLALHGYEDTGLRVFNLINRFCPSAMGLLAPNGPYLIPRKIGDSFCPRYSWYFYNGENDRYLVEMTGAVRAVQTILAALNVTHRAIIVVGYSQGGYLAPFVAQAIKQTRHIIGIGCEFLVDELQTLPLTFGADAIHACDDAMVNCKNAQTKFQQLQGRGVKGTFHSIPHGGHQLGRPELEIVRTLLSQLSTCSATHSASSSGRS